MASGCSSPTRLAAIPGPTVAQILPSVHTSILIPSAYPGPRLPIPDPLNDTASQPSQTPATGPLPFAGPSALMAPAETPGVGKPNKISPTANAAEMYAVAGATQLSVTSSTAPADARVYPLGARTHVTATVWGSTGILALNSDRGWSLLDTSTGVFTDLPNEIQDVLPEQDGLCAISSTSIVTIYSNGQLANVSALPSGTWKLLACRNADFLLTPLQDDGNASGPALIFSELRGGTSARLVYRPGEQNNEGAIAASSSTGSAAFILGSNVSPECGSGSSFLYIISKLNHVTMIALPDGSVAHQVMWLGSTLFVSYTTGCTGTGVYEQTGGEFNQRASGVDSFTVGASGSLATLTCPRGEGACLLGDPEQINIYSPRGKAVVTTKGSAVAITGG